MRRCLLPPDSHAEISEAYRWLTGGLAVAWRWLPCEGEARCPYSGHLHTLLPSGEPPVRSVLDTSGVISGADATTGAGGGSWACRGCTAVAGNVPRLCLVEDTPTLPPAGGIRRNRGRSRAHPPRRVAGRSVPTRSRRTNRNAAAVSGRSGFLYRLPITSISPLQSAQGQARRSFSRVMKLSLPSSHLMASSSPICCTSTGGIRVTSVR